MKLSVESLKNSKLASNKIGPMLKELPNRFNEKADQVLLGLSHSKDSIPVLFRQALDRIENNPNDIVGRIGRQVLERAEIVRKQLIEKAETADVRWVPDWLKDVSFIRGAAEAVLGEKKPVKRKPTRKSPKPKSVRKSRVKKS